MRRGSRILLILLTWVFSSLLIVSANSECDALIAFKSCLSDPHNIFKDWDAKAADPCRWSNITCNFNHRVTRIHLVHAGLSGQLVAQLGSLSDLEYLELSLNNISGKIPRELANLTSLVSLELSQNKLTGHIPKELGKLSKLRSLRLNNNTLSGTIPMSLTTMASLSILDLSSNNLSGMVPTNGSFRLFTPISFLDNPWLRSGGYTIELKTEAEENGVSTGAIIGAAVAVALLTATATFVVAAVVWWRRSMHQGHSVDMSDEDDLEIHQLGVFHWFFPRALNNFSLKELQLATGNFDPETIVGQGGFGQVYKGFLADGSLVAVKRLKSAHNKEEEMQFLAEVEMISLVHHRNLLRLQGFCITPTEKFLVYPYMANGSLASCLRARQGSKPLLDWPKRKPIALGSAMGLAYLHHHCDPKIIHCDVKAANILLNDEFGAVVADFGLAELMDCLDTHVTTVVRGTMGHIAPEYFSDGKCLEKTDIFGYGVMLLELISGQKATDLGKLAIEDGLMPHDWVKRLVENKKLERLVDGNLQGEYDEEEAEQLIQIALLCTQRSPMQRPTMSEVVRMLKGDGLAKRWEEWEKQEAFYREMNHTLHPRGGWIIDSTSKLRPDALSGPR